MNKLANETNAFSISIRNFQSLDAADIVLEPGLVIITGATNNGKSAIVRAIETAVFNNGDDAYVKAGTNELSVELNNGVHRVRYNRKLKGRNDKTTYQIDNGEVQQKVGRNQLDEVINALNIKEVRLQNNQRAKLNFWYQGEAPFLMDKTSGQLYEFLSVSSSEKYLKVLKLMLSDIKEDDLAIKTTTSAVDTIKKELAFKREIIEKNKGFSDLFSSLTILNNEDKKLTQSENIIKTMDEITAYSKRAVNALKFVTEELKAVPMEDVTVRVNDLLRREETVQTYEWLANEAGKSVKILYDTKVKLAGAVSVSNKSEEIVSLLDNQLKLLLKKESSFNELDKIEKNCTQALYQYQNFNERLRYLPKVSLDVDGQNRIQEQILQIADKTRWVDERRKEAIEVNNSFKKLKASEDALKRLETEMETSDRELSELKEKLGVCPFCGAMFTDDKCMF